MLLNKHVLLQTGTPTLVSRAQWFTTVREPFMVRRKPFNWVVKQNLNSKLVIIYYSKYIFGTQILSKIIRGRILCSVVKKIKSLLSVMTWNRLGNPVQATFLVFLVFWIPKLNIYVFITVSTFYYILKWTKCQSCKTHCTLKFKKWLYLNCLIYTKNLYKKFKDSNLHIIVNSQRSSLCYLGLSSGNILEDAKPKYSL